MAILKVKLRNLQKICSCCSKKINIVIYKDNSYRGGHYFGKLNDKRIEYWECPSCYR